MFIHCPQQTPSTSIDQSIYAEDKKEEEEEEKKEEEEEEKDVCLWSTVFHLFSPGLQQ